MKKTIFRKIRKERPCARMQYVIMRGKSESIREFPGLYTPRFNDISWHRIFHVTRVKSESERMRFLTRGGHTECLWTRYVRVCPYSQRIRVRIVWFQHRDTPHFTQCPIQNKKKKKNKTKQNKTKHEKNIIRPSWLKIKTWSELVIWVWCARIV